MTEEEKSKATDIPLSQKDRTARPEPNLEPVEGDEEVIDESLRQKEGKLGAGGAST